jgi:hypothetical protein
MTDVIDTLTDMCLIKKYYDYEKVLNEKGNIITKTRLKLELTTYDEWKNRPSQKVNRREK